MRTTNVRDHAKSDQHMHAMNRELARAKGLGPAPIAQVLCTLTDEGVELWGTYLNYNAGKEFTHFIAEATRQELLTTNINTTSFLSQLMALIRVIHWCDSNGKDEQVHSAS